MFLTDRNRLGNGDVLAIPTHLDMWRRAVEVGVGEHTHLGKINAFEFHLGRGPDPALRQRVLDLEECEGDSKHHCHQRERAYGLGCELAAASVAVEQTPDIGGSDTSGVPVTSVAAVGEQSHRQDPPHAAHTVDRYGADRIVDPATL